MPLVWHGPARRLWPAPQELAAAELHRAEGSLWHVHVGLVEIWQVDMHGRVVAGDGECQGGASGVPGAVFEGCHRHGCLP